MKIATPKEKLALGTAQLGLSYGINNKFGKPSEQEAYRILDKAASESIFLLDSAEAYGDSLSVIGTYLKKRGVKEFDLISKFIGGDGPLTTKIAYTLSVTGYTSLYAFMYHRFSDYQSGVYKNELLSLKSEGKVARIGVSLYSPEELESVVDDPHISVVQIPFHPWDASFRKKTLMKEARAAGKEIHVRSVFFQGLFFKKPEELTGNLIAFVPLLRQFQSVVAQHDITVREACLNYALHQSFIDRVIIGVETMDQLEENIKSIMKECPDWVLNDLEQNVSDTMLLNPSCWKR